MTSHKVGGAEFDVLEIRDGVHNLVQTTEKIKALIPGLENEDSLDAFWAGAIFDSKLGTVPVYVPDLGNSSSKLLNAVLIKRMIYQAIPNLELSVKRILRTTLTSATRRKSVNLSRTMTAQLWKSNCGI